MTNPRSQDTLDAPDPDEVMVLLSGLFDFQDSNNVIEEKDRLANVMVRETKHRVPRNTNEAYTEEQHVSHNSHKDEFHRLYSLGRSELTSLLKEVIDTMRIACIAYAACVNSPYGDPSVKVRAASKWMCCFLRVPANELNPQDILFESIINLLPQAVWLGKSIRQRYDEIVSLRMSIVIGTSETI